MKLTEQGIATNALITTLRRTDYLALVAAAKLATHARQVTFNTRRPPALSAVCTRG